MNTFTWRYGRKSNARRLSTLVIAALICFPVIMQAQASCTIGTAETIYICPPTNPGDNNLNIEIQTYSGSTYRWYRGNTLIAGPLAGTGDVISMDFSINSQAEAGHYRVERTQPGFPASCEYNKMVVYNEPIAGLQTTSITANAVTFSWTSQGKYFYELTTTPTPNGNVTSSTTGSATVDFLSGGTTYYIHIRAFDDVSDCSTDPGTTLSFTTLAGSCYPEVASTQIDGAGSYCTGTEVVLELNSTEIGQNYTWLKDGVPVSAVIPGNDGSITYNVPFSAGVAGVYSIRVTKPGCTDREFGSATVTGVAAISGLTLTSVNEASAYISWNSSGMDVLYEYALTTSPADPSTFDNTYTSDAVVSVSPNTNYYFHVRTSCGGSSWATLPFSTPSITAPVCSTATVVAECTPVIVSITEGGGAWNFAGTYPLNSMGFATPGKEKIYSFTPSSTGVYYIDVTSRGAEQVNYFYKPAAGGCNNTGWIGVCTSDGYTSGKFAIGMLQSGTTYWLLLDNAQTAAIEQSFTICKATLPAPTLVNSCIEARPLASAIIPANNPKEEFLIDENGVLIAGVDFSHALVEYNNIMMSYYVNDGPLRKDDAGREFMDRNFDITAGSPTTVQGYIGMRLFFRNSELQQLIDNPDDGLADVSSIANLNTSTQGDCAGSPLLDQGVFNAQVTNGVYDASSSFITTNISALGNIKLHGGSVELNYLLILPAYEDFDSLNNPKGWRQQQVGGVSSTISYVTSSINPAASAYSPARFVLWNSSVDNPAAQKRLVSAPISTIGSTDVSIEFSWLSGNNPAYNTGSYLTEGVVLEYSLDGTNWTSLATYPRHDPSLSSGAISQWLRKKVALPAALGNQVCIYIGFRFVRTAYGESFGLDGVYLSRTPACPQVVDDLAITATTGAAVSFNWTAAPSTATYEYDFTVNNAHFPFSGAYNIAATSTSLPGYLFETGKTYYIHVRPTCNMGAGSWSTVKFTMPGACPAGTFAISEYLYGSFQYRWQVDNGSGNFTNITNTGVYSGATTGTLTLTNPPTTFSNYRFRLSYTVNTVDYFYYVPRTIKFSATWTGADNNEWTNIANWACGAIPDQYTYVTIPTDAVNMPVINSNATCRNIVVKPGASLTVSPGFKLTVTGVGQ